MDSTELYQQILGITATWFVDSVKIDQKEATITVHLEHKPGGFHCPTCERPASVYNHTEPRTWRYLDTCQFQTLLTASVPRVNCCLTARIPWAAQHGRVTLMFEYFALGVLFAVQVQSRAAELFRISSDQVRWLKGSAVERGLRRRDPARSHRHVMVDEKSLHAGHYYITVLSDGVHGEVLHRGIGPRKRRPNS